MLLRFGVRCGRALVGLGPPLDAAMLCSCFSGRFSTCVTVVQLLPGVSSCVSESDDSLHVCFPGSSEAFDTEKGSVGLFCSSRVCGHCLAHVMRNPGSNEALESCGFCTWTVEVVFYKFVMLAACFSFVATVGGPMGPSGGQLLSVLRCDAGRDAVFRIGARRSLQVRRDTGFWHRVSVSHRGCGESGSL